MEQLVEYIVKQLVHNPSSVSISSTQENDKVVINVLVEKDDMGKVIGKNGKIAQAIRAIVKTASSGQTLRYFVQIGEKEN